MTLSNKFQVEPQPIGIRVGFILALSPVMTKQINKTQKKIKNIFRKKVFTKTHFRKLHQTLLILKLLVTSSTLIAICAHASEEKDIVVAIIDTGVDTTHPMIRDHLWINPREKINGLDDDGNGFADDLHGWNFADNNSNISDHQGHGTHITGIILQKAPSLRVKFMILKYYDPDATHADNLNNTVKAIRYATKMGANIINYSGGGPQRSSLEEKAIQEAQKKGIIFVAAAGNEGRNTDIRGYYPAGYGLSNIIVVAAMDSQRRLLKSSNYGSQSVDIVAPGKDIFSALPGGIYGPMTGTSQATAWVSGLIVSLLLKFEKVSSPEDIKKILEQVATKDNKLSDKIRSASRISSLENMKLAMTFSH